MIKLMKNKNNNKAIANNIKYLNRANYMSF